MEIKNNFRWLDRERNTYWAYTKQEVQGILWGSNGKAGINFYENGNCEPCTTCLVSLNISLLCVIYSYDLIIAFQTHKFCVWYGTSGYSIIIIIIKHYIIIIIETYKMIYFC